MHHRLHGMIKFCIGGTKYSFIPFPKDPTYYEIFRLEVLHHNINFVCFDQIALTTLESLLFATLLDLIHYIIFVF